MREHDVKVSQFLSRSIKEKGFNQRTFADKLGTPHGSLRQWIFRGEVPRLAAARFASLLGMTVRGLLSEGVKITNMHRSGLALEHLTTDELKSLLTLSQELGGKLTMLDIEEFVLERRVDH